MRKIHILISLSIIVTLLSLNISHAADKDSTAGMIVTQSTALNVRSSASTSSSIITKLSRGSYVTLLERTNNWWLVEFDNGKTGYVSADYIEQAGGSFAVYVNTESTRLNVRSGPGTNYFIRDRLEKESTVVSLSQNNGWTKILYSGIKIGYVSSTYLAEFQKIEPVKEAVYPALEIHTQRYRQADLRWADIRIGSYGYTIGQIGCLTTVVAMSESYRTGTTVTPDMIAEVSKYTATGALYWPGNYRLSYTTDYLNFIYDCLKEGKPVLLGGKTNYGGQHWVLVVGYEGGDILSASGFKILDPGRSNRTTLSQFFNDYPVYYKMAYYI